MAWPFINLPFMPFGRALQARQDLLSWFQAAVETAKQQLSQGQGVPGILGSLVAAVDENGNRSADDRTACHKCFHNWQYCSWFQRCRV
jgi:hypothetical protein